MHNETKRSLRLRTSRTSLLALMTGLVLFGLVCLPNSRASEFDKKTILTFSDHVQFPGVILGAGTYVVKRVDWGQPDILMISNSEENHSYAMVHAIPIQRMRPTDKVEVTFYETRGLAAPAVKALFYPGDTIGEQFIYPKGTEVLMGLVGGPVNTSGSSTSTETTAAASEPEASATTSEASAEAAEPSESENTEIAQATPPPAPSSNSTPSTTPLEERKELPKTATDLPLVGLLGGLALAAGAGLKSLLAVMS